MQGSDSNGTDPVERMEQLRKHGEKLEYIHSQLSKYKTEEDDLDKAWAEWEATFDAAKDSIMVINSDSRVIQANLATSHLLGKPLEEIIGQTCWKAIHGTEKPPETCPIKSTLSSNKREEVELHIPDKDIWVEVSTDPILKSRDKTKTIVHIMRDITERKKATELLSKSEEKYRAIFEGAVDGIVYADKKAKVIDVNPAFSEITGIPRDQVVGKSGFSLARRFAKVKDVPRLLQMVRRALSGKPSELYELEINNRIVEVSTPSLRKEKSGVTGIIRDITESKRSQKFLKESEEKYKSIFENIVDVYYQADLEGNLLLFSPSGLKLLGYERFEDLTGKNIKDLYYRPEDRDLFIQELAQNGRVTHYEVTLRRKDGTPVVGETNSRLIYDHNGKPVAVEGIFRDISDRRRAEAALRESEKRFREIFEKSLIGMYQTTPDGRILMANSSLTRMLGYSSVEELTTRNLEREGFEPQYPRFRFKQQIEANGSIIGLESAWRRRDGTTLFVRESAQVIRDAAGHTMYYQGTVEDITEQKRAEEALRASENRLTLAIECTGLGLWDQDFQTTRITRNDNWTKMLGYEPHEVDSDRKSFYALIHPDDMPHFNACAQAHEAGQTSVFDVEHRMRSKSGQWRWIRNFGRVVERDEQGKPLRAVGVHLDITERKKAEEAYRLLVDRSLQGLMIFQEEHVVFANPAMTRITGYTVEEMLSMSPKQIRAFIHPEDRELVWSRRKQRFQGKLPPGRYEFRGIRKDGCLRWFEIDANLVEYRGKPAIQAAYLDITERKNTEEREKKYIRELQYLSESVTDFVKLTPDEDIYTLIAEKINELNKGSIVSVNTFDQASHGLCVRALVGLGKYAEAVSQIMGANPVGQCFPIDDAAKEGLSRGELVKIPGGIYDLSPGIPRVVGQAIEKLLGLGDVYAMGLTSDGRLFGSATVLTRSKTGLENRKLTETFINQAAMAIHRWEDAVALQESKKRLIEAQNIARMGDFTWDVETGAATWSDALYDLLLYDKSEVIDYARVNAEIHHPDDLDRVTQWLQDCIASGGEELTPNEYRLIRKDGQTIYVRTLGIIKHRPGKRPKIFATLQDITERKVAEHKLADTKAFQSVLAAIRGVGENQSEQEVWNVFLESLVAEYGFKMAWFGSYENNQVHPLIWAGSVGTYLDGLVLDIAEPTDPDAACAMSQCIFSRQPFGYADLANDPGFKPWREGALKHGFGSNLALPFIVDGQVEGGVMVYASSAYGFSGERTGQLQSLMDDIAHRLCERRRRERGRHALQESESQLKRAQEVAHVGSWCLDMRADVLNWSDETYRIFGVPVRRPLKEADFQSMVHPNDLEYVKRSWADAIKGGVYDIEHRIVVGDTVKWVREKAELEYDPEGKPLLGMGTVQDITERKEMEQERAIHLRFLEHMDRINRAIQGGDDLEKMMGNVLDQVLDLFECDRAWLFYPCDPDATTWRVPLERTRPEYPGAMSLGVEIPMHPELAEHLRIVLESGRPVKFGQSANHLPLPRESDQFCFQSQMVMAIIPKIGSPWLFGLHQCSHARTWVPKEERLFLEIGRRLEDALTSFIMFRELKENKEHLQAAMDAGRLGTWDWDMVNGHIVWGGHYEKIFGFGSGEFDGRYETFESRVHPDDVDGLRKAIEITSREHIDYTYEYRILRPDGTIRWVVDTGYYHWDEQGKPIRMLGVIADITKRKEAEVAIQQSEEFLNSVVENTPNPMWLSDEKGTIIRINQALRELLQMRDEEIIGKYNVLSDHQLKDQGLLPLVEKVFGEGQVVNFELKYDTAKEMQLELRNHVQKYLELTLSPLRDGDGRLTNVICQHKDITERKKAEIELREYQEKLKAMASEMLKTQERERQHLAIGLHDDICQKLVLSKLTLESSLHSIPDARLAASLKITAETLGETIQQAESLMFELSNPVLHQFGLIAALEKYLSTEIDAKQGIAFELEAEEEFGSLQEDIKNCLYRVTRELLTNVVKHAKAQKVWVSVREVRQEIHVIVRDDGVGFESSKVRKEDFRVVRFGLFSVREQLEHFGGRLIIESQPGRGTVATVVI